MCIGLWLMIVPAVFDPGKVASNNERIMGPLVFSIACISLFESVRNFRYTNILCGFWLLVSPWILGYAETTAIANDMICGCLIILFSLVKGKVEDAFGGGWRSIFQEDPAHLRESRRRP